MLNIPCLPIQLRRHKNAPAIRWGVINELGGDGGELNPQARIHLQLAPESQIPFMPLLMDYPGSPMR